ncbi:hypothetical protein AAY473_014274 [Plecturocebus cupreus]
MDTLKMKTEDGLTLSPRLESSGAILTHYSLHLSGSRDPPTSAPNFLGLQTGFHHVGSGLELLASSDPPALAIQRSGFHHVGQVGLSILTSDDPPTSASQSAGITVEMGSHCVAQASLKPQGSNNSLISASQSVGTTSMSHRISMWKRVSRFQCSDINHGKSSEMLFLGLMLKSAIRSTGVAIPI